MQGIGIDIVEISRIRAGLERHRSHFLDKIFTPQEQAYCLRYQDPVPHYAGRFCAKEAIAKALGTGFQEGLSLLDIEICHTVEGKPYCRFSERVEERLRTLQVLISISHCKEYATAVAYLLINKS